MMETKTDKIINAFKKAAVELEEFQVQFALGKAEAKDTYEALKKKFNRTVHKARLKMEDGKEQFQKLHRLFDELQVQLALGKAETKDAFKTQQKKINAKLHEIEVMIKTNPTLVKMHDKLLEEFEKIKIKLQILEVNYNLSRLAVKDSPEKRRKEMSRIITNLQKSVEKNKETIKKTRWEHFGEEMTQAFGHLKAAFTA